MNVLILNQTFHPDTAATAQHMWDLARHLDTVGGHRVTVVTSRYRYGSDEVVGPAREAIGRIDVRRVRGTGWGKRSTLTRLADFASFYAAAAVELARVEAPDVVLALTSPPMVSTLALLQAQFRTTRDGRPVRFVYHVMDVYPDAALASGMTWGANDVQRAMGWLTRQTLEAADAVIVLGRDMRDRILARYDSTGLRDRVHVIPPWADSQELAPRGKCDTQLAQAHGLCAPFTITYSGNLGVAHDVSTLLAAMESMRDDAATTWVFIGGGKRFEAVEQRARDAGWSHVRFLPYQPREQLGDSLNAADVHLVSQLPAFTGIVVPSKLFGVMAVGKPSVMVGPADAECARIIDESGAGVVIANGDANGLVDALRGLREDPQRRHSMGAAARAELVARYDRPIACERIRRLLEGVVGGRTAPDPAEPGPP